MTENLTPPEDASSAHNLPEYSVGELAQTLRRTLEQAFGRVRVRGEITSFVRARSGHLYFSLKDEDAVLDAVCWKGVAGRLSLAPEDGIEVVCTGKITGYPPRSRYQMVVETMEIAGEGALLKLLEDRRRKLDAEGLFAAERKRALPFLPTVIGVVTSPTGAVIRDILHRLADRFPRHVLLWPVQVQGKGAEIQIAAAIEGFNNIAAGGPVPRPDLIIVARGGGSLEDLMAFNEEIVVRAAAASAIPLISAVGHETDTTLIDFASDLRAPTPTAAAEMAVPVLADLRAGIFESAARLVAAMDRNMEAQRRQIVSLARGLPDAESLLETATQRLDDWGGRLRHAPRAMLADRDTRITRVSARLIHPTELIARKAHDLANLYQAARATMRHLLSEEGGRLKGAVARLRPQPLRQRMARGEEDMAVFGARLAGAAGRRLEDGGQRLAAAAGLLESYSFERVLERGFVLVRDKDGDPVTSVAATTAGMALDLRFHDGAAAATVDGAPVPRKRAASKTPDEGGQGSLL